MDSRYDHLTHEPKTYSLWQDKNAFNADLSGKNKSFTIMMPPPNANDPLHIGHAMFLAIEDIMIRFHRMLGHDTLWVPGTDHAGIETQFVFEKKLKQKKQSRFQFDRQTLFEMIWDYVQENSDVAVNQMKKIGASADWSRFMFMLDPQNVEVVLNTFIKLHQDKLLYRDLRLVNFCVHCGTAFSDLEIDHIDQVTTLYYIKYPLVDDPSQSITIATVRPEPIWADTHLAVHPDNPKTKHLIGKQVLNPLTDQPMTIIADSFVDPEFGTGIVKLTPAHDPTDFDVAKKHHLPINIAITTHGKIAEQGGEFAGMKIAAAREAVVAKLEAKGLIEKIDTKYQNRIGTCYRCKRVIEPLPLPQFFISVAPLTKPVLAALAAGDVKVHGAGHDKILKHWLENLKDWNISRQIVWGIRMPIWYDVTKNPGIQVTFLNHNQEKIVGQVGELLKEYSLQAIIAGLQELHAPVEATYQVALSSPGEEYIQETDTFDTWFSSAQWPFSTLQALDLKQGLTLENLTTTTNSTFNRFYPTQVMETGYDILPFWVMRMLMMGTYATGRLPFSDIYLHGLVRDQKGQKMSKSKGNVINPLDIIEKYGADALRMALVIRSSAGLDKSVSEADFKAMRNLGNKIWNAARYVVTANAASQETTTAAASAQDSEFAERLTTLSQEITQQLTDFKIGLAAETVYTGFWHWFCDECIEQHKQGTLSTQTLTTGLVTFLQLLHPFVPFVTEAVWQELLDQKLVDNAQENQLLIVSKWPIQS
jgi:valyl-tRNA synthetase